MTEQRHAGGRQTFLGLAMVILGGLLFAAGVLVGRQLPVSPDDSRTGHLERIDQRDTLQAGPDGGRLVFHEELSKPVKDPVKKPPPAPPVAKEPSVDAGKPEPEVAKVGKREAAWAGKYSLQVASYRDATQAKELFDKLNGRGYTAVRVVQGEVPGKGTYFRVRLGPFPDRSTAEEIKEKLKSADGLEALVVIED